MTPPPIPRPAAPPPVPMVPAPTAKKRLPGWVWALSILGVGMFVLWMAAFSGIMWFGQQAKIAGEQPKRGVKYPSSLDDELTVGENGEFRYKNKKTGAQRTIWPEGDSAPNPTWLELPAGAERLEASGIHSQGRREASYQYRVALPPDQAHRHFERQLRKLGFQVRTSNFMGVAKVVNGSDASREAFVTISVNSDQGSNVRLRITEPSSRR